MGNVIKELIDDTVVDMLKTSEERARLTRVARFLVPDAEPEADEYDHYDLANLPEDELRRLVAEEVGEDYLPPKASKDAQVGGQWFSPLAPMMAAAAAAAVACVVVLPPNLSATDWLVSDKHTEKLHVSAPPFSLAGADSIGFDLFPSDELTEKIESAVANDMSDSLELPAVPAVIGQNTAYPASLGNDRTGLHLAMQFSEQGKWRWRTLTGVTENGYSVAAYDLEPKYSVGTYKPKPLRNGLTSMLLWNKHAQIDKMPLDAGSFETRLAAASGTDLVDNLKNALSAQWQPSPAASGADLVDNLKGDGPFTVVASIDEAFAAMIDEAFAAMPENDTVDLFKPWNKNQLISPRCYQVVPGKVMSSDLSDAMAAATLQGSEISFDLDDGAMINDANVTSADVEASYLLPTKCLSSEFSRFSELGDR